MHPLINYVFLAGTRDVAERTIESTSSACRYSLEEALEQPAGSLSAACEAEVGRILDDKAHHKAVRPVSSYVGHRFFFCDAKTSENINIIASCQFSNHSSFRDRNSGTMCHESTQEN